MKYPSFREEKRLWKQGYKYVIGLDEAGRGPLAGPVVAAAVYIDAVSLKQKKHSDILQNIRMFLRGRDSKMMSAGEREKVYSEIKKNPAIKFGIGKVSEKVIDKINILEATKLAMSKSLKDLSKHFQIFENTDIEMFARKPGIRANAGLSRSYLSRRVFLLIDGNFEISLNLLQKSIIKGDEKVFSIAAASVIAKVERDKIMQKMHKKYPRYGFDKHKGYGTKLHMANLTSFGLCPIHRKTFKPVINQV